MKLESKNLFTAARECVERLENKFRSKLSPIRKLEKKKEKEEGEVFTKNVTIIKMNQEILQLQKKIELPDPRQEKSAKFWAELYVRFPNEPCVEHIKSAIFKKSISDEKFIKYVLLLKKIANDDIHQKTFEPYVGKLPFWDEYIDDIEPILKWTSNVVLQTYKIISDNEKGDNDDNDDLDD